MSALRTDPVTLMFLALACLFFAFAWLNHLGEESPERSMRRSLLLTGLQTGSLGLLLFLFEWLLEWRYRDRSLYNLVSGAASLLLFIALAGGIGGKGSGRISLVLAAITSLGLWFSIAPQRLF